MEEDDGLIQVPDEDAIDMIFWIRALAVPAFRSSATPGGLPG